MEIITPYDPWTPKKPKTWQETVFEQQAIAEAEARMIAEAQRPPPPPPPVKPN